MRALLLSCAFASLQIACTSRDTTAVPVSKERLGELLFNGAELSEPRGQACADCHVQTAAFADAEDDRTSAGAVRERTGTRNTPTAMYARYIPPLHRVDDDVVGGLFWDGRASSLEEQAGGPLLNPLEMNNPDKASVVNKVRTRFRAQMESVFGSRAFETVDTAFAHVTEAIAAFERSDAFAPFSSRYDRFLAGAAVLDERELRGLAIFEDPMRGNCMRCHPSRPASDGTPPLFTTYGYANLHVPPFVDNPFYLLPAPLNPDGTAFVDHGLAKTTGDPRHEGMFRIPTLRNVARTTPYTHDGYFRRLDEMIAFIDAGDARIELTPEEVADVVAFLSTLTDATVEGSH